MEGLLSGMVKRVCLRVRNTALLKYHSLLKIEKSSERLDIKCETLNILPQVGSQNTGSQVFTLLVGDWTTPLWGIWTNTREKKPKNFHIKISTNEIKAFKCPILKCEQITSHVREHLRWKTQSKFKQTNKQTDEGNRLQIKFKSFKKNCHLLIGSEN